MEGESGFGLPLKEKENVSDITVLEGPRRFWRKRLTVVPGWWVLQVSLCRGISLPKVSRRRMEVTVNHDNVTE